MFKERVATAFRRDGADGGPRWAPRTSDGVVAVLLTLMAQVELLLADPVEGSMVVQSTSFMAMTVSVAWRRSAPLLAASLASAGLAAQTVAGDAEVVGGFLALIIVMYSVASYASLKPAVVGGLLIMAAVFLYPLLGEVNFADEVGNGAIFVGAWTLGRSIRSRQQRAVQAQSQLESAEREHDERMRAILNDERVRIARELHDIVAHGVSLMVLQSGAARQTIDRDPAKAKEQLLSAEGQGRQALAEMQRLLGVLRSPEGDTSFQHHSVAVLDTLLADVRSAGISVEHRVEGVARPLAPGLELSAYRIVQEALTNVVKHASATRVDIVVKYEPERLSLVVHDDGAGAARPSAQPGHGLVGMRERAGLFGGTVQAGPSPTGGWKVSAVLAIEGQP